MYGRRVVDEYGCPLPPHLLVQQNRFRILNSQSQISHSVDFSPHYGNQGHGVNPNMIRCRRLMCQSQEFYFTYSSPRYSTISNHPSAFRTIAQRRMANQRSGASLVGNQYEVTMGSHKQENYLPNGDYVRNSTFQYNDGGRIYTGDSIYVNPSMRHRLPIHEFERLTSRSIDNESCDFQNRSGRYNEDVHLPTENETNGKNLQDNQKVKGLPISDFEQLSKQCMNDAAGCPPIITDQNNNLYKRVITDRMETAAVEKMIEDGPYSKLLQDIANKTETKIHADMLNNNAGVGRLQNFQQLHAIGGQSSTRMTDIQRTNALGKRLCTINHEHFPRHGFIQDHTYSHQQIDGGSRTNSPVFYTNCQGSNGTSQKYSLGKKQPNSHMLASKGKENGAVKNSKKMEKKIQDVRKEVKSKLVQSSSLLQTALRNIIDEKVEENHGTTDVKNEELIVSKAKSCRLPILKESNVSNVSINKKLDRDGKCVAASLEMAKKVDVGKGKEQEQESIIVNPSKTPAKVCSPRQENVIVNPSETPAKLCSPQQENVIVNPSETPAKVCSPQQENVIVNPSETPAKVCSPQQENVIVNPSKTTTSLCSPQATVKDSRKENNFDNGNTSCNASSLSTGTETMQVDNSLTCKPQLSDILGGIECTGLLEKESCCINSECNSTISSSTMLLDVVSTASASGISSTAIVCRSSNVSRKKGTVRSTSFDNESTDSTNVCSDKACLRSSAGFTDSTNTVNSTNLESTTNVNAHSERSYTVSTKQFYSSTASTTERSCSKDLSCNTSSRSCSLKDRSEKKDDKSDVQRKNTQARRSTPDRNKKAKSDKLIKVKCHDSDVDQSTKKGDKVNNNQQLLRDRKTVDCNSSLNPEHNINPEYLPRTNKTAAQISEVKMGKSKKHLCVLDKNKKKSNHEFLNTLSQVVNLVFSSKESQNLGKKASEPMDKSSAHNEINTQNQQISCDKDIGGHKKNKVMSNMSQIDEKDKSTNIDYTKSNVLEACDRNIFRCVFDSAVEKNKHKINCANNSGPNDKSLRKIPMVQEFQNVENDNLVFGSKEQSDIGLDHTMDIDGSNMGIGTVICMTNVGNNLWPNHCNDEEVNIPSLKNSLLKDSNNQEVIDVDSLSVSKGGNPLQDQGSDKDLVDSDTCSMTNINATLPYQRSEDDIDYSDTQSTNKIKQAFQNQSFQKEHTDDSSTNRENPLASQRNEDVIVIDDNEALNYSFVEDLENTLKECLKIEPGGFYEELIDGIGKSSCSTPDPKTTVSKASPTNPDQSFSFLERGYCPIALPLGCHVYDETDLDTDENNNSPNKSLCSKADTDKALRNKHMEKLCDEKYNKDKSEILRPWIITCLDEIPKPTVREEFLRKFDKGRGFYRNDCVIGDKMYDPLEGCHAPLNIPLNEIDDYGVVTDKKVEVLCSLLVTENCPNIGTGNPVSSDVTTQSSEIAKSRLEEQLEETFEYGESSYMNCSVDDLSGSESVDNKLPSDSLVSEKNVLLVTKELQKETSSNQTGLQAERSGSVSSCSTELYEYEKGDNSSETVSKITTDNTVSPDSDIPGGAHEDQTLKNTSDIIDKNIALGNHESSGSEKSQEASRHRFCGRRRKYKSRKADTNDIKSNRCERSSTRKYSLRCTTENTLMQEAMNFLCNVKVTNSNQPYCFSDEPVLTRRKSAENRSIRQVETRNRTQKLGKCGGNVNTDKNKENDKRNLKTRKKPGRKPKNVDSRNLTDKKDCADPEKRKRCGRPVKNRQQVKLRQNQMDFSERPLKREDERVQTDLCQDQSEIISTTEHNVNLKDDQSTLDDLTLENVSSFVSEKSLSSSFTESNADDDQKSIDFEITMSKTFGLSPEKLASDKSKPKVLSPKTDAVLGLLSLGNGMLNEDTICNKTVETQTFYNGESANPKSNAHSIIHESPNQSPVESSSKFQSGCQPCITDKKGCEDLSVEESANIYSCNIQSTNPNSCNIQTMISTSVGENSVTNNDLSTSTSHRGASQSSSDLSTSTSHRGVSQSSSDLSTSISHRGASQSSSDVEIVEGEITKSKLESLIDQRINKLLEHVRAKINNKTELPEASNSKKLALISAAASEKGKSVTNISSTAKTDDDVSQTSQKDLETNPQDFSSSDNGNNGTIPIAEKPQTPEKPTGKWLVPILERLNIDITRGRVIVTQSAEKVMVRKQCVRASFSCTSTPVHSFGNYESSSGTPKIRRKRKLKSPSEKSTGGKDNAKKLKTRELVVDDKFSPIKTRNRVMKEVKDKMSEQKTRGKSSRLKQNRSKPRGKLTNVNDNNIHNEEEDSRKKSSEKGIVMNVEEIKTYDVNRNDCSFVDLNSGEHEENKVKSSKRKLKFGRSEHGSRGKKQKINDETDGHPDTSVGGKYCGDLTNEGDKTVKDTTRKKRKYTRNLSKKLSKKSVLKSLKTLRISNTVSKAKTEVKTLANGEKVKVRCVTDPQEQKIIKLKSMALKKLQKQYTNRACRFCKTIVCASQLLYHIRSKHPYRCSKCGLLFTSKEEKSAHGREEHSDNHYHCILCNMSFDMKFHYDAHVRSSKHRSYREIFRRAVNIMKTCLRLDSGSNTEQNWLMLGNTSADPNKLALSSSQQSYLICSSEDVVFSKHEPEVQNLLNDLADVKSHMLNMYSSNFPFPQGNCQITGGVTRNFISDLTYYTSKSGHLEDFPGSNFSGMSPNSRDLSPIMGISPSIEENSSSSSATLPLDYEFSSQTVTSDRNQPGTGGNQNKTIMRSPNGLFLDAYKILEDDGYFDSNNSLVSYMEEHPIPTVCQSPPMKQLQKENNGKTGIENVVCSESYTLLDLSSAAPVWNKVRENDLLNVAEGHVQKDRPIEMPVLSPQKLYPVVEERRQIEAEYDAISRDIAQSMAMEF